MKSLLDVSDPSGVTTVDADAVGFTDDGLAVVVGYLVLPHWWNDWSVHSTKLVTAMKTIDRLPRKEGAALRGKALQARLRFDRLYPIARAGLLELAPGMSDDFDVAVWVPPIDGKAAPVTVPEFGLEIVPRAGLAVAVHMETEVFTAAGGLVWFGPDGYETTYLPE